MSENHLPSNLKNGPRGNIKSKSIHSQTQSQWKEKLRRGCLERAKIARRERLRKSRSSMRNGDNGGGSGLLGSDSIHTCSSIVSPLGGSVKSRPSKRGREESQSDWSEMVNAEAIVDHTPADDFDRQAERQAMLLNDNQKNGWESCNSEENVVDTARALVEQELQRALTGLQHCHQVHPFDGSVPTKKSHGDRMDSSLTEVEEVKQTEDEYKITQEEFAALLDDVTEELQREDELLEEEIWEMERLEAMEREMLMQQIDDFESWEALEQQQQQHPQPSTYISPFADENLSPLVKCPICNSSSLMETPHGGIKCTNSNNCTFQLDIAHEGLTLNHLQNQLRTIYEEHSQNCSSGVLQFRIEKRVGMSMLMAKCDVCSSDVVVL